MKRMLSLLLAVLLLVSLAGCGREKAAEPAERKEPQVLVEAATWAEPVEEEGYVVTTAVLVEDGVPRELNREEYVMLTTQEMVRSETVEEAEPLPARGKLWGFIYGFTPHTCTIVDAHAHTQYALENRIAAFYEGAAWLTAIFEMTQERFCEFSEERAPAQTEELLEVIDEHMTAHFGYCDSVEDSPRATIAGKFFPSGEYQYATMMFIPRVMIVEGELTRARSVLGIEGEAKGYEVAYRYPVTVDGYCDGIYLLAEGDDTTFFEPLD